MKTTIELNDESELKKFIKRNKLPFTINFPDFKKQYNRTIYLLCSLSILFVLICSFAFYNIGYEKGFSKGIKIGYNSALSDVEQSIQENVYKDLSLREAISLNIRLNMDKYIAWIGLILGLSWVIHGVGFKVVG